MLEYYPCGHLSAERSIPYYARREDSSAVAGRYATYPVQTSGRFEWSFEPVNQVPTFHMWRDHLAVIAYELQHQHFERGAIRGHAIRGHTARPSIISTEDGIRNANISQWGREEVGRLWRELHAWAELDPLNPSADWNGVPRQELAAKIEGFCAACEGRGRVDLIHDEHDHLAWQDALHVGKRFIPDFSYSPFGIFELGPDDTMNGATYATDITNFRNAVRFYSVSHPDKMVDGWPDNLDSVVAAQALPPVVNVQAGAYDNERRSAARFFSRQYFIAANDPASAPDRLVTYRKHCAMNLLAVLRPENWSDQDSVAKMTEAQITAREYFGLNGTPIHRYWRDDTDPVWRHGYLRFYFGAGVYIRDARPLDPAGDPVTIPEDADSAGDERVSMLSLKARLTAPKLRGPMPRGRNRRRGWIALTRCSAEPRSIMQNQYATISGHEARFAMPHVGSIAGRIGIGGWDQACGCAQSGIPNHMADAAWGTDTDPPRDWVLMDREAHIYASR